MNSSEKLAKEIMKSFHSFDKRKQEKILSECGLSFQKKQQLSTIMVIESPVTPKNKRKRNTNTNIVKNNKHKKELAIV